MPKWIHDRAQRLQERNPSMPESQAWAIATQQAHALGKSPKGYGTAAGRSEARAKYTTPKDDQKTAFALSQYSTPLNPVIQSGASYLPPNRTPSLRAAVQKTGGVLEKSAAGAPTRGNFMMSSDVPGWRQPRLDTPLQKNSGGEQSAKVAAMCAMSTEQLSGFVSSLLEKEAVPRAVKEWQKAVTEGRHADADAIAKAYGKLDLAARHVKDISPGGVEAATDLNIGKAREFGGDASGYVLRKMYKPDSPFYGPGAYPRRNIDDVLQKKMELNAALRAQNPDMFPAMFGVKTVGDRGQHRVSYHEYVPGLRKMTNSDFAPGGLLGAGPNGQANFSKHVADMQDKLRHGSQYADDAAFFRRGGINYGADVAGAAAKQNSGNVMLGADGKVKVLDFMPATLTGPNDEIRSVRDDIAWGPASKVKRLEDIPALRKQIFGGIPGGAGRQAPKVRIGPAGLPPAVAGADIGSLLDRYKAPLAVGGATAAALGGLYALHKYRQAKRHDETETGEQKAAAWGLPPLQKNDGGIRGLPGGLAEKAHKTEQDFPSKKLDVGERVEHEHTKSHRLARSIAMDHLTEDPAYYTKLKTVEKSAADASPAVSWNGQVGGSHQQASDIPPFRAPVLTRALQKSAAAVSSPKGQLSKTQHVGAPRATAPSGPSIADIAKPKGEHFGIGIPGAFKGKI